MGHSNYRHLSIKMNKYTVLLCLIPYLQAAPNLVDTLVGYQSITNDDGYNGFEQAPYTVKQNYGSYEVRNYPSTKWVCTEKTVEFEMDKTVIANDWAIFGVLNFVTRSRSEDNQSKLFWKLFNYISGKNQNNQKIEMTVPVNTKMQILENDRLNKRMCFYIPKEFQSSPPEPTDSDVRIVDIESHDVIVKRFSGYVMQDSLWLKHAQNFREELREAGVTGYDLSYVTTAGYDSPMTVWNRRNEVMFNAN